MSAPQNETAQTVAATLRSIADWFSPAERDLLQTTAEQVELDWDGTCCPVCEETTCDNGCPLSGVRRDAGNSPAPSKGDQVT